MKLLQMFIKNSRNFIESFGKYCEILQRLIRYPGKFLKVLYNYMKFKKGFELVPNKEILFSLKRVSCDTFFFQRRPASLKSVSLSDRFDLNQPTDQKYQFHL